MGPSPCSVWTQLFPPKPKFTEKDLPDLNGKVYIVTDANTGVGKELPRILYSKNAKVYMGARSETKVNKAIGDIGEPEQGSTGVLVFLHLDLANLTSVKASAERFLAAETRLHVLFNNAGYMGPENGMAMTKQDYEAHLGVNCLGPFLLTKLLTPTLVTTAQVEAPDAIRMVFLSSVLAELYTEKDAGIQMDNLDYRVDKPRMYRYAISKIGNWAYAVELSKRHKAQGVIGVPVDPGSLRSELFRDQSFLFNLLTGPIKYPVTNGAYYQLFAGLSPEITVDKSESYVIPFGRLDPIRSDLRAASRSGGPGR